MLPRIYLDNAATSWPKPESVYRAVDHYARENGAPAGRGAYREAQWASRQVAEVRRGVARILGAATPERIVFTQNGTAALNLALHGLLRAGDHVVTTVVEHNSVLRPLRHLELRAGVEVTRVRCHEGGVVAAADIRAALRPNTRLIALIHASNVTGALQPVAEVAEIARPRKVKLLVDAAQSLGHVPVRPEEWGIDLLAAPGHKGLFGPLGTGLLYVGPGCELDLEPLVQGGTGTQSELDTQPTSMPERYEAGNLNVPGLLGLGEGVAWLEGQGLARVMAHERLLTERLKDGLRPIRGIRLIGPEGLAEQLGVVSLVAVGYDPQELAAALDACAGVQVRAGLHCAPLMHVALGTAAGGGTVRMSVSAFNTPEQIEVAVEAVASLMAVAP